METADHPTLFGITVLSSVVRRITPEGVYRDHNPLLTDLALEVVDPRPRGTNEVIFMLVSELLG